MEFVSLVAIGSIFLAGIVTAFLPCNYPIILGYISFLLGNTGTRSLFSVLRAFFWFFIGFTMTYIIFGSIAGLFGQFSQVAVAVSQLKPILTTLGGIFFILIGLVFLGLVSLPKKLKAVHSLALPDKGLLQSWWGIVFLGIIFATGWSPCIGPVLGGILILAGSSGSVLAGSFLLFIFSLGLMFPLLLFSLIYAKMAHQFVFGKRFALGARLISAAIFILLGILFITGKMGVFESFISIEPYLEKYI